jgi:hypothetical protein
VVWARVGKGSVPLHYGAACSQFPRAPISDGFGDGRAACQGEHRRLGYVGFGGALDDGGSLGPGGGKRAGDEVEDEAHSEAVTEPLESGNGTAAELERSGSVAYEKCDPGGPYVVDGTLIAERRAELETFAEAGTSVAGVGLGDGRAPRRASQPR